jgi:hypothetical protein
MVARTRLNVTLLVHFFSCTVLLKLAVTYSLMRTSTRMWGELIFVYWFNPLTPELNPSAQRCLTRFFTVNFASLEPCISFIYAWKTNRYTKLFIQFINYVWYLLHVSALHCHLQGAYLGPTQTCTIEQLSEATSNAPWSWQCNPETCRRYHT